jgi:hypothetical protein
MRFRPANIRLINRRSNLPRLLLVLSSINGKSNDKNNTTNVQRLTGHSISGRIEICAKNWAVESRWTARMLGVAARPSQGGAFELCGELVAAGFLVSQCF